MRSRTQIRNWGYWSWLCIICLLLMNFAQAVHVCDIGEGLQPLRGAAVQNGTAEAPHAYCTICASSHAPSLVIPLVSLPSAGDPVQVSLTGTTIRISSAPGYTFRIRPPPVVA